jgi:FtsH-binding integral membrane protein
LRETHGEADDVVTTGGFPLSGTKGKHAFRTSDDSRSAFRDESRTASYRGGRWRLFALGLLFVAAVAAIVFASLVRGAANATEDGSGLSTGLTLLYVGPLWAIVSALIAVTCALLIWRPVSLSGYVCGCVLGGLAVLVGLALAVRGFADVAGARWLGVGCVIWGCLTLVSIVAGQVSMWTSPDATSERQG